MTIIRQITRNVASIFINVASSLRYSLLELHVLNSCGKSLICQSCFKFDLIKKKLIKIVVSNLRHIPCFNSMAEFYE